MKKLSGPVVSGLSLAMAISCSTGKKSQSADAKTNSADQSANTRNSAGTGAAVKAPAPTSPVPGVVNGAGSSLGALASQLGASGFSAAQLGQLLSTPAGAAIFTQILANPGISAATGIPQPLLTTVANNPQLVASLLQNPQFSAAIDQALSQMISQDPTLLPKIMSSLGSATGGATPPAGTSTVPAAGATPTMPATGATSTKPAATKP